MDLSTYALPIAALSFVLSFVFALGGVGSALVLIPVLTWLGVPFHLARPVGLFVNTVSMLGATVSNLRHKRLDVRLGLPIVVASVCAAPVGAWVSHLLPTSFVMMVFAAFTTFSGSIMLFFKRKNGGADYREDTPTVVPFGIGIGAGLLSGLLGVGGGGLISPLLIWLGFNPKRVATVTAFAVPFSSFAAFLAYTAMGSVAWSILGLAGLAAWAGGYLGTKVMHARMAPEAVRTFLGVSVLLLAAKLLYGLF